MEGNLMKNIVFKLILCGIIANTAIPAYAEQSLWSKFRTTRVAQAMAHHPFATASLTASTALFLGGTYYMSKNTPDHIKMKKKIITILSSESLKFIENYEPLINTSLYSTQQKATLTNLIKDHNMHVQNFTQYNKRKTDPIDEKHNASLNKLCLKQKKTILRFLNSQPISKTKAVEKYEVMQDYAIVGYYGIGLTLAGLATQAFFTKL